MSPVKSLNTGSRNAARIARLPSATVTSFAPVLRATSVEMPHLAVWALAVDIEAHVGVGRHRRQIEAGVVGESRREMQVRGRIGLEQAERRITLEHLLGFRQPARVGSALVIVDGEAAETELGRRDEMAAKRKPRHDDEGNEGAARAGNEAPGDARGEPQRERRGDQVYRRQQIHRAEEYQAAEPGPREI